MNASSTLRPDLFITAADGTVCPAFECRDRIGGGRVAVSYTVQHPTDGAFNVTARRVAELRAEGRVEPAPAATVAPSRLPAPAAPRPPGSTAARLARAARAVQMRTAHAAARGAGSGSGGDASTTYSARLAEALRTPAYRRCSLGSLRRQAAEFVRVCAETGARFDAVAKACDALRFSAETNARGLCIPSKLTGTASYQDAAAAVGVRLDARGGWVVCERDGGTGNGPHAAFALGMRLGAVQPKHARTWLPALGTVRVAVTAVTGGRAIVTPDGRAVTTTRGVNVAVEVGPALLARLAQRHSDETQAAIRAGRLVEVGPGCFVPRSRAASSLAWVQANGGHARAWGRLD